MTTNNLFFIHIHLHGFMAGKSCVTQLLEFLEYLTEALDQDKDVDIIYLVDFCKAFDKVPHKRLFKKLYNYGITGKVHQLVKEFLSGGKQRVVINGSKSNWQVVSSRIPQGSVLGPVLFLIFINDLHEVISVCIKLFADDAKLYTTVNSIEKIQCLQENLGSAVEWANAWNMFYNDAKCYHLHIGSRDLGVNCVTPSPYHVGKSYK